MSGKFQGREGSGWDGGGQHEQIKIQNWPKDGHKDEWICSIKKAGCGVGSGVDLTEAQRLCQGQWEEMLTARVVQLLRTVPLTI